MTVENPAIIDLTTVPGKLTKAGRLYAVKWGHSTVIEGLVNATSAAIAKLAEQGHRGATVRVFDDRGMHCLTFTNIGHKRPNPFAVKEAAQ